MKTPAECEATLEKQFSDSKGLNQLVLNQERYLGNNYLNVFSFFCKRQSKQPLTMGQVF